MHWRSTYEKIPSRICNRDCIRRTSGIDSGIRGGPHGWKPRRRAAGHRRRHVGAGAQPGGLGPGTGSGGHRDSFSAAESSAHRSRYLEAAPSGYRRHAPDIHHDRMPVVLPRERWATWLGEREADPDELRWMVLRPYPAALMRANPVDVRVGNVRNNDAALLEEISLAA